MIISLVLAPWLEIAKLANLEKCVEIYAANTVEMDVWRSRASVEMGVMWGNLENFAMKLVMLDTKLVVIKIPEIVSLNRSLKNISSNHFVLLLVVMSALVFKGQCHDFGPILFSCFYYLRCFKYTFLMTK